MNFNNQTKMGDMPFQNLDAVSALTELTDGAAAICSGGDGNGDIAEPIGKGVGTIIGAVGGLFGGAALGTVIEPGGGTLVGAGAGAAAGGTAGNEIGGVAGHYVGKGLSKVHDSKGHWWSFL